MGAPLTSHRCLVGLRFWGIWRRSWRSNILRFIKLLRSETRTWRNCPHHWPNCHTSCCLPLKVRQFYLSEQAAFFNAWFTFGRFFLQVQWNSNLLTIPVFFLTLFPPSSSHSLDFLYLTSCFLLLFTPLSWLTPHWPNSLHLITPCLFESRTHCSFHHRMGRGGCGNWSWCLCWDTSIQFSFKLCSASFLLHS